MSQKTSRTQFNLSLPFDASLLRSILIDTGYSQTSLAETICISKPNESQDVEVVSRRVKGNSQYSILVRLFWLGKSVNRSILQKALPKIDVESLSSIGLLNTEDGMVRSNVKLAPYHDLYFASDFGTEIGKQISPDHVLGVGAASLTLANLTIRRNVKRVLDIGCGAGVQAFLAAKHGEVVIGTDINQRALNFAAFNTKLNNLSGLQWRLGSLYEPVPEEQFDLIISNPPFVISPESKFIYRDTKLPGDAISELVIRGADSKLDERAFACILFNWHHRDNSDWSNRPLSWVADINCDAWLICFKTTDPLVYAADWLRQTRYTAPAEYGPALDRWMEHYDKIGIGQISAGVMILRKRTEQQNWARSDRIEDDRSVGACSDQIEHIFANEDLLRSLDNENQLLEHRLLFHEHHYLEHKLVAEDGLWAVKTECLHNSKGIPFSGTIDMCIAQLLADCVGHRTLRESIEKIANQTNTGLEELIPVCLTIIQKLMRCGFLTSSTDSRNTY